MIYVIYRHTPADGYNNSYDLEESSGVRLVQEEDYEGWFGSPPMYIRRYKFTDYNLHWLLITYTNEVLDSVELEKIRLEAFELLKENGYI